VVLTRYRLVVTVSLKGQDAERVCLEVLRQLGDRLPPDFKIKIDGGYLSTSKGPQPTETFRTGAPGYEEARRHLGRHAPLDDRPIHEKVLAHDSGTWAIFGFGAWIPFVPRKLAIKLAYIDVVETIQDFVSSESGAPWPGEGFEVRAEPDGDAVRLWFEDKSGATRPGVTLPLDLATRGA
jgi:hypothetical protein